MKRFLILFSVLFLYLMHFLSCREISLWIDEKQVREFSDQPIRIYAITDGNVVPLLMDPNFEHYLPIIPSEVVSVNFTWQSGDNKLYKYSFDQLISYDHKILYDPTISIEKEGEIPRRPSIFRVHLPCVGNISGVASFAITLRIHYNNKNLAATPLRLKLKKQCIVKRLRDKCDAKCANGGYCNSENICECPKGYLGENCQTALCFPKCMNGGICISPGVCECVRGYQGPYCEGGICTEKCLNGGKCNQKDKCTCRKGYYGKRCEYSKCMIPCLNGGRCVGLDECKCRKGYSGSQCETFNPRKKGRKHKRRKQKIKFV